MKKSSAIVSFLVFIFLSGCSPWMGGHSLRRYENSPIHMDPKKREIEFLAANVFRIQTSLKFKLGEISPTISAVGLATSLDPSHLLTARHVVKIQSFQTITPLGPIEFPIPEDQKLEEETFIVLDDGSRIKLQLIHSNEEKDIALLKAEKEIHYSPFPLGNSEEMEVGNFVFLFGNFQTGSNIRTGYVTQLNFVRYGSRGEVSQIDEYLFGISAITVEGDSGGPIFLLRGGRFELGGIVTFSVPQARGLGFGVKINAILDELNRYRNENKNLSLPFLPKGTR